MQSTNQPGKFLVPFAQNDSAKVEIPVTSSDAARASQSAGFPPLTGMPPEAGGVPPQLEDFNGAVNQVARVAWWMMQGGRFPFDATFAADSNIAGYAQGSLLPSADRLGEWYSTANANVANPDTVGTGWVPGYHYGVTQINTTGGTITLTPAQAAKTTIILSGTLTSNLTVILPAWVYYWEVFNTTSGAFTVTVKTAAGTGVVIPQNSLPTPLYSGGANIAANAPNVPNATSPTQAMPLGQAVGRLLNVRRFSANTTYTPTPGTTAVYVEVQGAGGSGGGAAATGAATVSVGAGGSAGGFASSYLTSGFAGAAIVVGAGGTSASGNGVAGGTSSFGTVTATGGAGGGVLGPLTSFPNTLNSPSPGVGTNGNIINATGSQSLSPLVMGANNFFSGAGGSSRFGGGGLQVVGTSFGNSSGTPGSGGSGAAAGPNSAAQGSGGGGAGVVIVYEYA